jgi:hypothetical protein
MEGSGTRITEVSEYNNIHNPYVHNSSHQHRYKGRDSDYSMTKMEKCSSKTCDV